MPSMDWSKLRNVELDTSGPEQVVIVTHFRTVQAMERAAPHLNNVQELLKNAIFLQQQLKYEQSRRSKREAGSLYQRFSSHLNSVDLPAPAPDLSSGGGAGGGGLAGPQ